MTSALSPQIYPAIVNQPANGRLHPSALGCAIPNIGGGRGPCAMGAAEKSPSDFDAMPNDPAFAVFANRSHGLDRALEAVKRVSRASRYQFETFVVFVTTNFTGSHNKTPFREFESKTSTGGW
jgi:hypothetical protein